MGLSSLFKESNAQAAEDLARVREEAAARNAAADELRRTELGKIASEAGVVRTSDAQSISAEAGKVITGEVPMITDGMERPAEQGQPEVPQAPQDQQPQA